MDGWENDRGERLCPGCSFCVCGGRGMEVGGGSAEPVVYQAES